MALQPLPLNLMTLYADLAQNVRSTTREHGSIVKRRRGGRVYLYVVSKDGAARSELYLGPADDPGVAAQADAIREAAIQARSRRTAVSVLKQARVPAPTLPIGRVVEVVANAGLFERGVVLIGTVAFQVYGPMLGYRLPSAATMTNDADLLVASFVTDGKARDLEAILRKADPTFRAVFANEDRLPKLFRSASDLSVDVVTRFGRGRTSPVQIAALSCAAEALTYMEYLAAERMETVVLYGAGVLVGVPPPGRFAVHKLLVAQERRGRFVAKRGKDLVQARDLMEILRQRDPAALDDAMDDARARGRAWRTAIDASLADISRGP